MQAGIGHIAGHEPPLCYLELGHRPVTLSDIQGGIEFLARMPEGMPLLLLSCCPGFAPDAAAEQAGVVFYAGRYRRMLDEARLSGRLLVSVIHTVTVGGTYLMHGLAAPVRLAVSGTAFYDTVYPGRTVPLETALTSGLVTEILLPDALPARLRMHVAGA